MASPFPAYRGHPPTDSIEMLARRLGRQAERSPEILTQHGAIGGHGGQEDCRNPGAVLGSDRGTENQSDDATVAEAPLAIKTHKFEPLAPWG
jgi:hypothetical protein